MEDKHNHHKQPRHFLRGFAQAPTYQHQKPSDIWVYRRGIDFQNGINPSLDSIDETGSAKDYYAFTRDDGTVDFNTYENLLMTEFEQPNERILDKIRGMNDITADEKAIFSKYIGAMILRGDWGRNISGKAMSDMIGNDKSMSTEQINQLKSGDVQINGLLLKAREIADKIAHREWHFLHATEPLYFITGDKPVAYSFLDSPKFELIFPLSKAIALSISYNREPDEIRRKRLTRISKNRWEADYHMVGFIRRIMCAGAFYEVYGPQKAPWLVDLLNNHPTLESLQPLR